MIEIRFKLIERSKNFPDSTIEQSRLDVEFRRFGCRELLSVIFQSLVKLGSILCAVGLEHGTHGDRCFVDRNFQVCVPVGQVKL